MYPAHREGPTLSSLPPRTAVSLPEGQGRCYARCRETLGSDIRPSMRGARGSNRTVRAALGRRASSVAAHGRGVSTRPRTARGVRSRQTASARATVRDRRLCLAQFFGAASTHACATVDRAKSRGHSNFSTFPGSARRNHDKPCRVPRAAQGAQALANVRERRCSSRNRRSSRRKHGRRTT